MLKLPLNAFKYHLKLRRFTVTYHRVIFCDNLAAYAFQATFTVVLIGHVIFEQFQKNSSIFKIN